MSTPTDDRTNALDAVSGSDDASALRALAPLEGELPAPRRTDAAFARAVAEGVRTRRTTWRLALPSLAAVAAGLALFVIPRGAAVDPSPDAGAAAREALVAAMSSSSSAGENPEPPAGAGAHNEQQAGEPPATLDELRAGADFTIPALEGSSDEELARLDRALDAALAARSLGG